MIERHVRGLARGPWRSGAQRSIAWGGRAAVRRGSFARGRAGVRRSAGLGHGCMQRIFCDRACGSRAGVRTGIRYARHGVDGGVPRPSRTPLALPHGPSLPGASPQAPLSSHCARIPLWPKRTRPMWPRVTLSED
ncbi:hypothetical protein COLSTE_00991 [Collinsella stercoris DSM 13279]|uniref:Uncharacterized protein n=1 Tax=Collinsella stercoris DSM 13279 TaxID=445975 RepID=B6GA94_9ACTN|nr:hypothetical protein COLSTE_00991 [Collinsella stercoris DSM 13279]